MFIRRASSPPCVCVCTSSTTTAHCTRAVSGIVCYHFTAPESSYHKCPRTGVTVKKCDGINARNTCAHSLLCCSLYDFSPVQIPPSARISLRPFALLKPVLLCSFEVISFPSQRKTLSYYNFNVNHTHRLHSER